MSEHSVEDNLDFNGLLLLWLAILIVSSNTFWSSGITDFEMRASLSVQETVCEKIGRVLLFGQCNETF